VVRPAREVDVVIVGGGIIGCAAAWAMSRAGLRVTLVERHGIAGATTGSCMGHIMVTPSPPYMLALTLASVKLWHALAEEVGGFEFRPTGALWLAKAAADVELLEQLQRMFAGAGEPSQRLAAGELRRVQPGLAPDLAGGLLYPRDAVLMPMKAAGALLAAARAHGAEARPWTAVRGITRRADGSVAGVVTDCGDIAARAVVNATGAWAPELTLAAGLPRAPIFPRRGDLAITTPLGCSLRMQLLEVSYLRTAGGKAAVEPDSGAADPGAHALNVQPQTHDSVLIGSTRQFAGFDRSVSRSLLHASLREAARFVPALGRASIVRTWSGLRPYSKDKLPLVGPVAAAPGFYLASGHEGLGITLAPITAAVLTDMITGKAPGLDAAPMSPDRFLHAAG
jgi:glycine/D-amino acid oxidase-like deaminating enzyme